MNKEEALKEKFKIALTSTIKVISEKDKVEVNFENKNLSSKNFHFFDLDNLKSLDDYTKILDKMTREIPILPFVSLFLYGDPLLNPQVADIIRKSAEYGVSVDVSTNLNFAKYLEEVISASPSYLSIPCSGIKENYELTHTGGHWDVFEKNLRLVRKYIDKYNADTSVQLSYHLYKHNLDYDYDYVRALTDDLGFEFKSAFSYHSK